MAGRCFEQIRNSVAYPNLNVKLVGTHAGLSVGEDGATHQCLEDIGILRTIPNMTILNPCDAHETRACVEAAIVHDGPVYLRLGRSSLPDLTGQIPDYHFELGRGIMLRKGGDVAIVATGLLVHEAMKAADLLAAEGVYACVVDMPTIKPLDRACILEAARTGAMVVAEEHNTYGGLCDAVTQVLLEQKPIPLERIAVRDCFGHSGKPSELLEYYGLSARHIVAAAKKAIANKH
ncbi:MAG: transketolase family protein, partial [Eubacteriales bacterium]|nr:transketolase family protein [Eubacteriales bacterium]